MKLIDTHCHIYVEEFKEDLGDIIERAHKNHLKYLLLPNIDSTTISDLFQTCDTYPEFTLPMMGLHPTSVEKNYIHELNQIEKNLLVRPYCAIGEIGIDLYWDKTYLKEQKIVFEEQLKWSIDLNLPVSIHTRDAFSEVLESIHKVGSDKLSGVFHSFTGNSDDLQAIIDLKKFKIGINGVVTFKNSSLSEVIKKTSLKNIILETDAPYLTPAPYRGRRNESSYLLYILTKVAETFNVSAEKAAEIIYQNSCDLFKIVN